MYAIFFAIFMALSCPVHNHKDHNNRGSQVTTLDDTGGDNGQIPPPPPPKGQ